ncbi:MAG: DUF11 domain-containing protein [Micromonosporaceae bacterium]|nr:DUF11 domain-containing protein [Micromonosporaceae bacterium]
MFGKSVSTNSASSKASPLRRGGWAWRAAVRTAVLALIASGLTLGLGAPAHAAQPASISVVASADPVASGSQLTYTITVGNTSDGALLEDVVITDQIEGMTGLILTSTVGACSQTGNLVTCDVGALEGFQTMKVTIRGVVTAANGETLHNTATIAGTHASNTFTTSSTSSTLVSNTSTSPKPDLSVSVQGPSQIGEFDDVKYDLTVNNSGNGNANEITLINTLPLGFSYVSAAGSSLFVCADTPPGSLTVTCTGGRINAGANATITIQATSGADPGPYENTAKVDPYDEIAESNELNNAGSLISQKPAPAPQQNLTITKTDLVDPIRPGDIETYQIHVVNTADRRADSVTVVDGTQGLDAASVQATTTKGACTVAASKVTCTQTSPTLRLDPGEAMDITIKGKVVATAGSLITNTATVTGNIRNTGVSNTATTTTTVRPGKDLTVVQHSLLTHSDPPAADAFRARDNYDYEITVGNSGLDDATNVVVREPLPDGVLFKGFTPPPGQPGVVCGESNGVVTCTGLKVEGVEFSGLPGGTIEKITLNVIAPPYTGVIEATVTVDPTNAIYEPDETNNTHTTPTKIETGVDLTIMKDSEPVVAPSGTLIYTITVSNLGTQDTTGVEMRDILPAGTRFREVVDISDHNFTCKQDGAATGGVINCVGGILRGTFDHTLPVDTATFKVTLFAPAPPGLIKNQVRVDPDHKIAEMLEDNNVNTRFTDIQIGGCCAYHEFNIDKKQVFPASAVAPSGVLEYDIVVTNTGSDVAFDVAVRDFIPDGATFRFAEDTLPGTGAFSCAESGGVINCTGGTLDGTIGQTAAAGDSTRTIHIGLFAPAQPGEYRNQALVDPGDAIPEADETNNSDVENLIVALGGGGRYIDLEVDSTQTKPTDAGNPTAVAPSGTLQYTLKVSNTATAVAFNVTVRDVIPDGAVFRSAVDTNPGDGAFTCGESGGVVECTGGTLDGSNNDTAAAGDNVRFITIDVFAPEQPGSYTNQALIDPGKAIAEADETNNSDTTTTAVALGGGGNFIDLKIKSIESQTLANAALTEPTPGQDYKYVVTVENTGTDVAFNVDVRNVVDSAATYVKTTATNDLVCTRSDAVITCTGGSIDGSNDQDPDHGSEATIEVFVKAPRVHNYEYGLSSRVDPANTIAEASEANNAKSANVTVKSRVDLKTETDISSLTSGAESEVTFKVLNAHPSPVGARNFLVVLELPVGVIPLNVNPPAGWTCQIEENPISKVTCVGDLDATPDTFTVRVYTTAQGETVTATAIADPDNRIVEGTEAVPDPAETNNTSKDSKGV